MSISFQIALVGAACLLSAFGGATLKLAADHGHAGLLAVSLTTYSLASLLLYACYRGGAEMAKSLDSLFARLVSGHQDTLVYIEKRQRLYQVGKAVILFQRTIACFDVKYFHIASFVLSQLTKSSLGLLRSAANGLHTALWPICL